LQLVQKKR
jgi:hypothetical protein